MTILTDYTFTFDIILCPANGLSREVVEQRMATIKGYSVHHARWKLEQNLGAAGYKFRGITTAPARLAA